MRRDRRLLVLATTAGIVLAGLVTAFQDSTYRADASVVLVRQGQAPGSDPQLAEAADAAAELFDTRAVAESAIRNLGLDATSAELLDRVGVEAKPSSSLVRIEVDAPSREEARRTAQEVSEVATVLFNDRFAPQTVASVWEPASAGDERVSPKPARNLVLGALLGALAGWAVLLLSRRRPARPGLVRRSPEATREPTTPEPVAAPAIAEPPIAPPQPATGPFVLPGFGEWTVADVERLLAEQGPAFPERRRELEIYLDSFREVAAVDGHLPGEVYLVLEDVFGDLIDRAR